MFALKISRDCYKIVFNLYCAQSNARTGMLIGYGNKEHIMYKFDMISRTFENTVFSRPYIEEYNCVNDTCKCNNITHYKS